MQSTHWLSPHGISFHNPTNVRIHANSEVRNETESQYIFLWLFKAYGLPMVYDILLFLPMGRVRLKASLAEFWSLNGLAATVRQTVATGTYQAYNINIPASGSYRKCINSKSMAYICTLSMGQMKLYACISRCCTCTHISQLYAVVCAVAAAATAAAADLCGIKRKRQKHNSSEQHPPYISTYTI